MLWDVSESALDAGLGWEVVGYELDRGRSSTKHHRVQVQ